MILVETHREVEGKSHKLQFRSQSTSRSGTTVMYSLLLSSACVTPLTSLYLQFPCIYFMTVFCGFGTVFCDEGNLWAGFNVCLLHLAVW